MSNRNILTRSILAVALGAFALGAQADERPGFYAGAGAGQAMIDDGALDDEDTAFSAFGGYQFTPYFGLEAGFADFGEIEPLGSAGPKLEGDSGYLVAVGTVPFTDSFSAYAKAGVNVWDVEASIPGLVADDSGTDITISAAFLNTFNGAITLEAERNIDFNAPIANSAASPTRKQIASAINIGAPASVARARCSASYAATPLAESIGRLMFGPCASAIPHQQIAHSGSRFHASRNERTASSLAKANIIWKPWSKNAWASLLVDEIGRVKVPRPFLNTSIGSV